jgi:homoserine kinase
MSKEALLPFALEGERYASGGDLHADNVAPSLMGGLVLCPAVLMPQTTQLKTPTGISSVLLHPELQINTAHARRKLARTYTIEQWLSQQGYLAGFIAGCASDDHDLIRRSLHDVVIEPQRAAAIVCFDAVKKAAIETDALGASISGSGPSIFALCPDSSASTVAAAMERACRTFDIECQSWISPMTAAGAHVEDIR